MSEEAWGSLELLAATHVFPGPFVFKVIGTLEETFAARVVTAVREELSLTEDPPHQTRQTPNGRHASVTIEPQVQSAEEVVLVFRRVRDVPGVVMVF